MLIQESAILQNSDLSFFHPANRSEQKYNAIPKNNDKRLPTNRFYCQYDPTNTISIADFKLAQEHFEKTYQKHSIT